LTLSYAIFLPLPRLSNFFCSSSLVILIFTHDSIDPFFLVLVSLNIRLVSSMLDLRFDRAVNKSPPSRIFSLEVDLIRKCLLVLICGKWIYSYIFEGLSIIKMLESLLKL
jgi:hypothetical protein